MSSLVWEMKVRIYAVLLGDLFSPGGLAVPYMGFRLQRFRQFLVRLVYLLGLVLRYGVVFQGYCYYYCYLLTQFLQIIFYAPEPGPCVGIWMNGGAMIMRGVSSCSGRCVCAPRFHIQMSLFSSLQFN